VLPTRSAKIMALPVVVAALATVATQMDSNSTLV
jgi:hypothetical protein